MAAVGSKAAITDSRKNCQLNLQLEYSAGYSFAVYSADYTGFADLDAGVTGTVKSNYYFSGETDQVCSSFVVIRIIRRTSQHLSATTGRLPLTITDLKRPGS